MCDYSLHGVKNRLVVEGEQLFVNKFGAGSKGLASRHERNTLKTIKPAPAGTGFFGRLSHWLKESHRVTAPDLECNLTAICVPPGAKLYIEGLPKAVQEQFGVGEAEEVTFVQVTNEPFQYRDAIRFENGEEVLIQKIPDGVVFEVLSLDLEEKAPTRIPFEQAIGRSMRANA